MHTWKQHLAQKNDLQLAATLFHLKMTNQTTVYNFSQPIFRMFPEYPQESIIQTFAQKGFLLHKPEVLGVRAMRMYSEGWAGMMIDEGGIWGKGGKGLIVGNRMAANISRYKNDQKHHHIRLKLPFSKDF